MMDGIIKADGTSRLMRAELPATYEEFRAQCRAGAQPLDVLFNALGWSQLPTFLNKGNLASDNTLALFGLSADAVPDDVFRVLSRFQNGLGNEYVWEKTKLAPVAVIGAENELTLCTGTSAAESKGTVYYVSELNADGTFPALYNTVAVSYNNPSSAEVLKGKYWKRSGQNELNYTKETATVTTRVDSGYYDVRIQWCAVTVEEQPVSYGYVNSPDSNAYPVDDGFTYTALGQLGNKVQIATGSYTGTGTYGADNPNSITPDFEPTLVILVALDDGTFQQEAGAGGRMTIVPVYLLSNSYTQYFGFCANTSYNNKSYAKKDGNTLYWYNEQGANVQFNKSGGTYYWLAIG